MYDSSAVVTLQGSGTSRLASLRRRITFGRKKKEKCEDSRERKTEKKDFLREQVFKKEKRPGKHRMPPGYQTR